MKTTWRNARAADIINEKDKTDIYRTLHPNTKQCIFPEPHGTFSKKFTKDISTDIRKLKYSLYPFRQPESKAAYQLCKSYNNISELGVYYSI